MILNAWLLSFLFLIGISIGSFINALEYRLYSKVDFVRKRSMCTKCKHKLAWYDLLPIVSFCLIGGKCRYCGTKVSWQYPIIEFVSGALFLLSGCYVLEKASIYSVSDILQMLCISVFFGLFAAIFLFFALYDVKHQIVPNRVVYPTIVIAILCNIFFAVTMHFRPNYDMFDYWGEFSILWNIVAGLLGGLFVTFVILITNGKGMGGGDMKYMILLGLILGWKRLIIAFYIAIISGAIIGLIWGFRKGKIKGLRLPFALFLSFGAIISVFYGLEIFNTYLNFTLPY